MILLDVNKNVIQIRKNTSLSATELTSANIFAHCVFFTFEAVAYKYWRCTRGPEAVRGTCRMAFFFCSFYSVYIYTYILYIMYCPLLLRLTFFKETSQQQHFCDSSIYILLSPHCVYDLQFWIIAYLYVSTLAHWTVHWMMHSLPVCTVPRGPLQ